MNKTYKYYGSLKGIVKNMTFLDKLLKWKISKTIRNYYIYLLFFN